MSDNRQDDSTILKNKMKRRKSKTMQRRLSIQKADYLQAHSGGTYRIVGKNLRYSTDGQRRIAIFKEGPDLRIEDSGAKPPDLAALFEQASNTAASNDHRPDTIEIPQNECSVSTDTPPAFNSNIGNAGARQAGLTPGWEAALEEERMDNDGEEATAGIVAVKAFGD